VENNAAYVDADRLFHADDCVIFDEGEAVSAAS
jgi:hypothetical protein